MPMRHLNLKTFCCMVFLIPYLTFADSNYKSLQTPKGFSVELFASDIVAPRQMAEGNNFIFVGGIKGDIYAIEKNNSENKIVLASNLNNSRGLTLHKGDLYFAEVSNIWMIEDVERSIKAASENLLKTFLYKSKYYSFVVIKYQLS